MNLIEKRRFRNYIREVVRTVHGFPLVFRHSVAADQGRRLQAVREAPLAPETLLLLQDVRDKADPDGFIKKGEFTWGDLYNVAQATAQITGGDGFCAADIGSFRHFANSIVGEDAVSRTTPVCNPRGTFEVNGVKISYAMGRPMGVDNVTELSTYYLSVGTSGHGNPMAEQRAAEVFHKLHFDAGLPLRGRGRDLAQMRAGMRPLTERG